MGKYTVIADTSRCLVEFLQKHLVPEVIANVNEIGLRSPEEHKDVSLGLFLYDIQESNNVRPPGAAIVKNDFMRKVPMYLSLFYMITAYSTGDVKYRLEQEERILGKVLQTFHDYPVVPLREVDREEISGMDLRISMLPLDSNERSHIWNFPNAGNRLSLFYKVDPVTIDSGLSTRVTRVTDVDIQVMNRDEKAADTGERR